MNTPFLSIITITKNNIAGLKRTHASIIKQSTQNYEWIIIDGASEDATSSYIKEHNLIAISEEDNGIYDAMNKGIERANGQYILFLNAGDALYTSDTIEKLQEYNTDKNALIYGDSIEAQHYKQAKSHLSLAQGLFTHHQSILYKTEIIKTMRYDSAYKIAADYELTIHFIRKAKELNLHIAYAPIAISIFEQGGVSQKNAALGRKEQFEIRQRLKLCTPLKNQIIYNAQKFIWAFRQYCPNLYWHLKSSGNIATLNAQNQTPQSHP